MTRFKVQGKLLAKHAYLSCDGQVGDLEGVIGVTAEIIAETADQAQDEAMRSAARGNKYFDRFTWHGVPTVEKVGNP